MWDFVDRPWVPPKGGELGGDSAMLRFLCEVTCKCLEVLTIMDRGEQRACCDIELLFPHINLGWLGRARAQQNAVIQNRFQKLPSPVKSPQTCLSCLRHCIVVLKYQCALIRSTCHCRFPCRQACSQSFPYIHGSSFFYHVLSSCSANITRPLATFALCSISLQHTAPHTIPIRVYPLTCLGNCHLQRRAGCQGK
jgi:hypothetical protein